ncbi:MAG: hydrogenase maturation protease [Solirubrobacteraceae bacterium]
MTEFTPVAAEAGTPEAVKRILVAAVGNQWLQDDGFGPAVAKLLLGRRMPDGVTVIDFGTGGLNLAYEVMAGYDALILIDITRQGHPPGTLYTIEPDEEEIDRQIAAGATLDLHGMNPTAVLRFVKQVSGSLPARVLVIACEPELVVETVDEMDMVLSETIKEAIPRAAELTLATIDELRGEPRPS